MRGGMEVHKEHGKHGSMAGRRGVVAAAVRQFANEGSAEKYFRG